MLSLEFLEMGGGCCIGDCCIGDCSDCCVGNCGHCCVGDAPSNRQPVNKSGQIADELAEKQRMAAMMGRKEETGILEHIDRGFGKFLQTVKKLNARKYAGRKLFINIDGIREKTRLLRLDADCFIVRRMAERLAMTDKELSIILAEADDSLRNANFDGFYDRIMKNALSDLRERVRRTAWEQHAMVEAAIKQRLAEIGDEMEAAQHEQAELRTARVAASADAQERRIGYLYRLELCGLVLDRVGKAKKGIARRAGKKVVTDSTWTA